MLTKRLSAVVLMACLLVALAFGGAAAWAAGSWWDGGGDTLTVNACDAKAEFADDVAKADVVVDVIQIATATPHDSDEAFDYTPTGDYAALKIPANPTNADWQALAEEAAKIAKPTASGTAAAGTKISDLDDGLYLVLAHGEGITDKLIAHGEEFDYEFAPAIVALPSKAADVDGNINTAASYGPWLTDVVINMKPEQMPQYGDIRITKTVQDFSGEEATFVFHLVGTTPDGDAYDNYAAITCGASGETTVTHIPAGTKLTVTEEYSGAVYEFVSGDSSEKTISASETVSAAFANRYNGSGKTGSGIQNNFTAAEDGDWVWSRDQAESQE